MSTFHEVLDIIGVNKDDWEKFGEEWRKSGKDCPGQVKAALFTLKINKIFSVLIKTSLKRGQIWVFVEWRQNKN